MSDAVSTLFGEMHRAVSSVTVGQPITYRLFVSAKLNPATGKTVEVFHDVRIRDAVLTAIAAKELIAGGPLQVGDQRYEFATDQVAGELLFSAARALSSSDRLVDGTTSYRVILWDDAGPVTTVAVRK